jgi:poly(ADP-ribose) glycohydrolase ARH3
MEAIRFKPRSGWPEEKSKEKIIRVRASLKKKYLGGMIGSALGDAIGEIAYRYPEGPLLGARIDRLEELSYTDDTAMAIGLAESIKKLGRIDQKDLGNAFRHNYIREPWRGYAPGPPALFALVERSGMSYPEAARSLFGGSGSLGNGAAMRIVPVGLFFYNSVRLYENACASAEVTHAHPVGMDGAAVQAMAIAQAVPLDPQGTFPLEPFIRELIEFARTPEIREKMILVKTLLAEDTPPDICAVRLGRSVAVHESMPFAIYSFLRNPRSFVECLFCAVLHGGDRDTLGAMAGAISGAYLGIDAVPRAWQGKLENRGYIERLATGLAETCPLPPDESPKREAGFS